MKVKCRVEEDGSVYVVALNAAGEHRKAATLGVGQEIELDLPAVSDENGIGFGEVISTPSDKPADESAEAPAETAEAEDEGGQTDTAAASDTPTGDSAGTPPEEPAEPVAEIPAGLAIGRAVTYRSKTGSYDLPAVVTATIATLDPTGVELGHVPPLTAADHVHLTVFTCGKQGTSREGNPVNNEAAGGSYQEFDIPQFVVPELGAEDAAVEIPAGTWRWPERV